LKEVEKPGKLANYLNGYKKKKKITKFGEKRMVAHFGPI
jgi:hypothetical protein